MEKFISGESYDYELIKHSAGFSNCIFRVLERGLDTGHVLVVHLYGGIDIPKAIKAKISVNDCNKLSARAVKEYKRGYHF